MPAPLVNRTPVNSDLIAQWLMGQAAYVHAMPPSWNAAKDTLLISAGGAARYGRGLPGRGIVLDVSLKSLGITKPIPHVYDRPLVERVVDKLGGRERLAMSVLAVLASIKAGPAMLTPMLVGAITDFNGVLAAAGNGKVETNVCTKAGFAATYAAQQWAHYFSATGWQGAFAFTGALGASAPDGARSGSLMFGFTAPTGGDKAYLLSIGLLPSSTNVWQILQLSDVLYECGGISATSASSQSLGAVALTRYTSGVGVMATITPTVAWSNTATTVTLTYTNTTPTGSRSGTIAHVATSGYGSVDRLIPAGRPYATLASGDVGITSVESVQLSGALAAGTGALFLHKPLVLLPGVAADMYVERDTVQTLDGLIELVTTSGGALGCPMILGTTNSTGTINLSLVVKVGRG